MITINKSKTNKPKPKCPLKTRVKIINETYRNGEFGYIVKIKEAATPNDFIRYIYYVQFRDKTIASFSEENVEDEHFLGHLPKAIPLKITPYHIGGFTEHIAESVKKIGAISTAFTEADVATFDFYYESTKSENINSSPARLPSAWSSPIREVTHKDVTTKHFINWFFELEDWVGNDPEGFHFDAIIHNEYFCVYGYFNKDKLDGIIRIDEREDRYELSFFGVNKSLQGQGVGQYLFQWVLRQFTDKKLILSVYKHIKPAIHIYKKYGFRIVGSGYGAGYFRHLGHYVMQKDVR